MKKFGKRIAGILCLVLAMATLITLSYSCRKAEMPEAAKPITHDNYDTYARELALAVSRVMATSSDFRQIIKHEAMKQIDGDYDVLLGHIAGKKLSDYNTLLKKSASDIRIKDLLGEQLADKPHGLKSSLTVIDDMIRDNPDLQVSVPVHCEDWDPENYVPDVAIVGSTYDEATTEVVDAYTPEGNLVSISAIEEPTVPVVVVGLNERSISKIIPIEGDVMPETPTDLGGIQTESGIRLTWTMPSSANSSNTTGYYIYRKGSYDTGFEKIGSTLGCYCRAFDDNAVEPSKSYSYYVASYYGSTRSASSNYITVSGPARPKPVASFDVIQLSDKRAELRWQNDYSQSFTSTEIYKYCEGEDDDYRPFMSASQSDHYCFDDNIQPGKKYVYKIHHKTDLGLSNAKYDFTIVPYRDISHPSPVYIQGLKFSDWRIEGWLAGKPEFFVTVGNVDLTTGKTYMIQKNILLEFGYRTNTFVFPDVLVFNWDPGIWYDMITFSVVEQDAGGNTEIKFSAGFNSKNADKMDLMPVNVGIEGSYPVGNGSENCGCYYLNYYDDPDGWLRFPNYGVELLVTKSVFAEVSPSDLK